MVACVDCGEPQEPLEPDESEAFEALAAGEPPGEGWEIIDFGGDERRELVWVCPSCRFAEAEWREEMAEEVREEYVAEQAGAMPDTIPDEWEDR